jgi:hypothetical protein
VLREHGAFLQHWSGVAKDPIDRHASYARDLVGGFASTDAGLDVAWRQHTGGIGGEGESSTAGCGLLGAHGGVDPLIEREGKEPANLVSEHKSLAVL